MKTYLRLLLKRIVSALCERCDLVLENIALRHQIDVFKRSGIRPQLTNTDRLAWVLLSTVWPRWPEALEIVHADTVKRWRRQGFGHYLLEKVGGVGRDVLPLKRRSEALFNASAGKMCSGARLESTASFYNSA